jgi:hypothetical protein
MNTAAHPVAPDEIMAFLDGELSAGRTESVSAHINQCAECREAQAAMRATSQEMATWTVDAAQWIQEHTFLSNVQRVASQKREKLRFSWLPEVLTRKRIVAPAVALVIVVFAVVGALTSRYAFAPQSTMKEVTFSKSAGTLARLEPPHGKEISVDHAEVDRGSGDALKSQYFVNRIPFSPPPPPPAASLQAEFRSVPMIARSVSLSIVVKDFDVSRGSVDVILSRHNGYAAQLNVATPQDAARTLQASLRIPAPELVKALAEMKALGRVEMEAQNGEEVTRQHADLVARLKNSRETEQRLQAILTERTGKISDVLSVEQEIARVRGEIEQMEAEQQTLEHRVEFATIDLKLAEEYKAQLSSPAPSVATQLRNAFVNGFRNGFESVLALILFFAKIGPAILLWLVLLFFPARLLWRRYRRSFALTSSLGA